MKNERLIDWKLVIGIIALVATTLIAIWAYAFIIKTSTKGNASKEVASSNIVEKQGTEENISKNVNDVTIGEILNAIDEVNKENEKTKAKELIRIKSISTSKPNSASGVDLSINWTNISDKTIKYITFTVYPVNAVNDIVYSEINSYLQGQFKGKETGPIKKGEGSKEGYVYSNAWYNNTIVKAILMQVDIEYMDGTTVLLSGSDLDEAIY